MTLPEAPDAPHSAPAAPAPEAFEAAGRRAIVADAVPFALMTVEGADAADFLHTQLSSDFKALAPGSARWTSYNSPKGRVLATLFAGRLADGPDGPRFIAWLAEDMAAAMARRLRMFVLRSKVVVAERGAGYATFGLGGPGAPDAVREALGVALTPGHVLERGDTRLGCLPDGRILVTSPAADHATVLEALSGSAQRVPSSVWTWLGIRAAVPTIDAATTERFVAQEANLDVIGALDFRKGCYPGQEIVARTQYLGRLKERLFLCEADATPPAGGTRLFHPIFGDQPCGEVVNAAFGPAGSTQFLAVLQIAAGTTPGLALGAPGGPVVSILQLPYVLPEPSAPRPRLK